MPRIPGRKIARRLLRPLTRALYPGAVVIGYHRIADTDWDPFDLAVSPDNFAAQLATLGNLRQLVGVSELAARRAGGQNPASYAAVTFDDGYTDFAESVLPMLEKHRVPATVFVASGFLGGTFWWDEIASLLAPSEHGAAVLEMPQMRDGPKRYDGLERAENRAAAALDLSRALIGHDETEIRAVIDRLRAWAGRAAAPRPDHGAMDAAVLTSTARHELVEVGAHTVSHAALGRLPREAQHEQIAQSKAVLESLTQQPVTAFSYPNGSYSRSTPTLVETLGFTCACASRDGTFGSRTDAYRIPRLWAPNVGGPEFRRWLGNWIGEAR